MPQDRFPSLYDVGPPEGAEGWEELYNWYHLRGEERRESDEQRFWFQDRLHHPEVMHPYDEIQCECWWQGLGAFNTRIFAMPPAYGIDQRVVNGYLYISPIPAPPEDLEARAAAFGERAGHYYENWDAIYEEWKVKTVDRLEQMKAMRYEKLPDLEDPEVVTSHRGSSSGYKLIEDYSRMVNIMYETYQFHFELLNIGYAAYLTFFAFVKEAFPDISDQTISRMVGGLHVDLYRPDDELKRLAKSAVDSGIGDTVRASSSAEELFGELRANGGKAWVEDWEATADPWFVIDTAPGHPGGYAHYGTWASEPDIPLGAVKEYIAALQEGRDIDRPTAKVLEERERITGEYRELLAADDVEAFDDMLALARKVFVYIEEHVIYIEHWMWATFWAKSHELSRALTEMGAFDEPQDMFFLRRTEVMETIYDVVTAWGSGGQPRGRDYWRPIVERRRAIYDKLKSWDAPPALGIPPTEVNEPFTVMLWGITTDAVQGWLESGDGDGDALRGQPGSPGVVEGRARVVRTVQELEGVEPGDVLVCPATSPAWSPVFARVAATVSDVGGVMSHTAIICREYGLPAVVGTGNAVSRIEDGQQIRVDGDTGVVTLL
jgi:pyruvate,water dikinase